MEEFIYPKCPGCKKDLNIFEDENFQFCPYCGSNLYGRNENTLVLDNDIETLVYNWLSKKLMIDTQLVSETVKNQMATVFLLIWPILETNIFGGNTSNYKMKNIAEKVENHIKDNDIDGIFTHFYDRYTNPLLYKKLYVTSEHQWDYIDRILEKELYRISKYQRIVFMIYVVYRYRNNIFHGTKSINHWNEFAKEIQLCIEFMIVLANGYDEVKKD